MTIERTVVPSRLVLSTLLMLLSGLSLADSPPPLPVTGMVWQPDYPTRKPQGSWDQLGVKELLVQWTAAGDYSFVDGCGSQTPKADLPDWKRIAKEAWAQSVILGLAGDFDETKARRSLEPLIDKSRCLAALRSPLHIAGWYFPVEADPSWNDAPKLGQLLARLPRPLWISVYDNSNIGPKALADWLDSWLPKDVGVFFQDGVGVYAREAPVALQYFKLLQQRLGPERVRLIAEVFRPTVGGGFRAATTEELLPQLRTYTGERVFLFDGPHYLSNQSVQQLLDAQEKP